MLDQARFEAFLLDLATRLSGLAAAQIDDAINRTLRQIVETTLTDRASLVALSPDEAGATVTHTWGRSVQDPTGDKRDLTRISRWLLDQLSRGETVALSHLPDDLPAEARLEREAVRAGGVKSALFVPAASGGRFVHALSIVAVRVYHAWPAPLVTRLRLTAQLLAWAVARTHAETPAALAPNPLRRRPPPPMRSLGEVERDHIRAVLERCHWKINGPGHAAEVLRLHPNTLRFRMKRLGIERPRSATSGRKT